MPNNKTTLTVLVVIALMGLPGLVVAMSGFKKQLDYPLPELTYNPAFDYQTDAAGDYVYSKAGYCKNIHTDESPRVVLRKYEPLDNAVSRLRKKSPDGGVIEIHGVIPIEQCNAIRLKEKHTMKNGLTLEGHNDKDGRQPRFYCRSDDPRYNLGGTIPAAEVVPAFLTTDGSTKLVIKNIHVDGYKSALKLGQKGHTTVMQSWFHHGPQSGISNTNTGRGKGQDLFDSLEKTSRFDLEFCGNEISHYGQGNHTHNFYMHRGLGGWPVEGFDTWSEITLVDNLIHSPGWASAFKSIANRNNIHNNRFYSHLKTDPGFIMQGKHAQMLIDVPSCSENYITGNELHNFKPTKSSGGSALIGLRGRRTAMRGCDIPLVSYPYTSKDSPVPITKDPNDPIHSDDWWTAQNKRIWFPTVIENNLFTVEGPYSHRQTAIQIWGTRPLYEGPKKVNCFLPIPNAWYERSRMYSKNNTFIGFNGQAHIYEVKERHHNKNCANQPQPAGPEFDSDLFEVAGDE